MVIQTPKNAWFARGSRLLAGAAFVMLASVSAIAADMSFVDDRGLAVAVPEGVHRIASVSYFAADVALALGLKPVAATDMVQGRNPDFLGDHMAGILEIGQHATPNLELLAQADPDVIIAMRRYTEGNADQYQAIAPYLAYNLELYSDSDRTIMQVATILGKQERAKQLNDDFKAHIADIAPRRPRTFTSVSRSCGAENLPGHSTPRT